MVFETMIPRSGMVGPGLVPVRFISTHSTPFPESLEQSEQFRSVQYSSVLIRPVVETWVMPSSDPMQYVNRPNRTRGLRVVIGSCL